MSAPPGSSSGKRGATAERGERGGATGAETLDGKLEDLKKRLHLLQGDRKAYLESSQWSLQQAKHDIKALRHENMQLYKQAAEIQTIVKINMEGNNEAERLAYQLRELRKKYDEIKHKVEEKSQLVNKLKDTMNEVLMEAPTSADTSADRTLAAQARLLETKIDKAIQKTVEALSVKRTYEQILDHLHEDRVGYDSHVDSLEHGVQSKDKELTELTALYQDAIRSKELAKEELFKCESQAIEERKQRDQITDDKKQRIKQLMEANARMERKLKREEQRLSEIRQRAKPTTPTPEKDPEYFIQRLNTLSNAYQTVSALAGVGNHFSDLPLVDVHLGSTDSTPNPFQEVVVSNTTPDFNTISQYISAQAATARTLETHQAKATARLETLKSERASLADTVSNLRLRQLVPPGTRKQVDSYEGRLAQTNATCARARSKYERAAKANGAILSGVSSLASKLQFVEPEEEFPPITDQNLSEVIQLCKRKIEYILSATKENPTNESPPSAITPFPPQFTIRVKHGNIAQMPEQQTPDESQVPTRASVKSYSSNIVERELKKSKRKKKSSSSSSGERRTPPPTSRNYTPSSARTRDSVPSSARHK